MIVSRVVIDETGNRLCVLVVVRSDVFESIVVSLVEIVWSDLTSPVVLLVGCSVALVEMLVSVGVDSSVVPEVLSLCGPSEKVNRNCWLNHLSIG